MPGIYCWAELLGLARRLRLIKNAMPSRIPRPFRNAHWALFAALVAMWVLAWWDVLCKETPYYFELGLVVTTILVSLWVSHLRHIPVTAWRGILSVLAGSAYDLVMFAGWLLLVSVPLAIFTPAYPCYLQRARLTEVLSRGMELKHEISERLAAGKSLSEAVDAMTVTPSGRVKWGRVTSDGLILLASDDPIVVVIIEPSVSGNEVRWKCRGFPVSSMPKMCRE